MPVTCHPPNGVLRALEWNRSGSTVQERSVSRITRFTDSGCSTAPRSSVRLVAQALEVLSRPATSVGVCPIRCIGAVAISSMSRCSEMMPPSTSTLWQTP